MAKQYRVFLNSVNSNDIHYMGKIVISESINSFELKETIKAMLGLNANDYIKLYYYYDDKIIMIDYVKDNEVVSIGHLALID